jgi:NADH-quinone oxidoreductase subunit N
VSYIELLKLAAPETIVVLTALAVLAVDLTSMRGVETRMRMIVGGMLASVGCLAAIFWMLIHPTQADALHGMLVVSPLTQIVKVCLLGLTIATVLVSLEAKFTAHPAEYLSLILLATVGMMFLVSAEDVLMIFIALELTSLSLYILTAFNKQNIKSAEAALKYFLFGGMAAAFMLFGLSLIYGLSGATNLHAIAAALAGKGLDPLLMVAIVMTVIGFGFKVAAVPFHLWAPDAYEGAPSQSAAFIASGSKLASFFIFAKIMMIGFAGAEGSAAFRAFVNGWTPLIAVIAAISMVLGNLVAIVQSSVKRLLAYSAIAHAGYMLLGVLAHDQQAIVSVVYYAATYGLATIGAFGVVALAEDGAGDDKLSSLVGFSKRAPIAAFAMMIFLAGFFGKFYLFAAALKTGAPNLGLLWLVILAVAMSAVSFYYYLKVLKQIYVVVSADKTKRNDAVQVSTLAQVVLLVIAIAVIVLGCFPNLLVGPLKASLAPMAH